MTDRIISAYSPRSRWLIISLTTLFVVGVDQAIKWYAWTHWRGMPPRSYFNDLFRIEFAMNPGAFLGLGGNLPDHWRFAILILINGLMLVGLAIFLLRSSTLTRWTFISLVLVVAGGAGNMIDRIRFGEVIDFWNLGLGGLRTGIFNFADMAITAGFLMLLPYLILGERTRENAACDPTPSRT